MRKITTVKQLNSELTKLKSQSVKSGKKTYRQIGSVTVLVSGVQIVGHVGLNSDGELLLQIKHLNVTECGAPKRPGRCVTRILAYSHTSPNGNFLTR